MAPVNFKSISLFLKKNLIILEVTDRSLAGWPITGVLHGNALIIICTLSATL
jgi:hypothetical protein